jgi:Na+/melibiose symporter-like transporter
MYFVPYDIIIWYDIDLEGLIVMKTDKTATIYRKATFLELILFSGNETATTSGFNLVSVFFVLMMTDNLLLSGIVAGLIFTFSRVLDAFTDPILGTLIDKTVTRFGKFRPFMLIGSTTINFGLLMIFGGFIRFNNDIIMYLWIILWYVIYIIGYTIQSSVTRSAQTVMTNDPIQRPLLGAMLSGLSYLFYGIFLVFAVQYVNGMGTDSAVGYRNVALIVIGTNILLTLLAIIGIWNHDKAEQYEKGVFKNKKVEWSTMLDVFKNNQPLRKLIIAAGTNKLAQLLTAASVFYFFTYTVRNIDLQQTVAIYGLGASVLGVLLGMWFAQVKGRKTSFMIGTYIGALLPVLIMIIHPFTEESQWILIILLVGILFATALATTNILPMIADVADFETYINKRYVPNIVGTTFSLVDKFMSSFSGIILAVVLGAVNYETGMEPNNQLFWAFYIVVIIIPLIGHIASIIAMRKYPLTQSYYDNMIGNKQ